MDEIDELIDEALEEEPVTFTLLMRDGSLLSDQTFMKLEDNEGRTCALGAVIKGAQSRGLL